MEIIKSDLVIEISNIDDIFEKIMDFNIIQNENLFLAYFRYCETNKIKVVDKIEKQDNQKQILKNKVKNYVYGDVIYLGLEDIFKYNEEYYIILDFLDVAQIVQNYRDLNSITIQNDKISTPIKLSRTLMDLMLFLFKDNNKKIILEYINNHYFQMEQIKQQENNFYILSFIQPRINREGKLIGKFFFDDDIAQQMIGSCIFNFYTDKLPCLDHTSYNYQKQSFNMMKSSGYNKDYIYFWSLTIIFIYGYRKTQYTIQQANEVLKFYEENQTKNEIKYRINQLNNNLINQYFKGKEDLTSIKTFTNILSKFIPTK